MVYYQLPISAGVVELVDTGDLKSPGSDTVPVRVLSPQPESPDFLRNQDFFRTFALNNLLAVFSDPIADPNGSG